MKKFFVFIFLIVFLGCDEKEEVNPGSPQNEDLQLKSIFGDEQSATFNTFLNDSLVVRVLDTNDRPVKNVWVSFDVETEAGSVIPDFVKTDSNGVAYAKWQLGCNSGKQMLTAYLLDSISRKMDSVSFSASPVPPTGWGRSCGTSYETTAIARHPSGNLFSISGRRWLKVSSDNGINWKDASIFLRPESIEKMVVGDNGDILIATELGILMSQDGGVSWSVRNNGIDDYRYPEGLFSFSDGRLFFSSYFGGLYRSVDNGLNWEPLRNGLPVSDRYFQLCKHPTDGTLYVMNDYGDLYKSVDGGDSWNYTRTSATYSVTSLMIDDEGVMYLGASNYYPELYKSTDNGVTWERIYQIKNTSSCYIEIKNIHKFSDAIYFYAGCKGVYRYKNAECVLLEEDEEQQVGFNSEFLMLSDNEMVRGSYDGVWYNFNF